MQPTEKPNYYGIMPATVRYSKDLKPFAKVLFCELTALTQKQGYCNATNKYFADLYEVTQKTISRTFAQLDKHGFIKVEIDKSSKGTYRRIYCIIDPLGISQRGVDKKVQRVGRKSPTGGTKKSIQKNNTSKNITRGKDRPLRDIFPNWHERTTGVSIAFSINDYSHCDRLEDQLRQHAEKHGRTLEQTVDAYLSTFYALHQQKYWCCDTLTIRNVSKHYAEIMPKVKFMSDQEAKVLNVHRAKFEKDTGIEFQYGTDYLRVVPLMKSLRHRVPSTRLLTLVKENNGNADKLYKQLKAI